MQNDIAANAEPLLFFYWKCRRLLNSDADWSEGLGCKSSDYNEWKPISRHLRMSRHRFSDSLSNWASRNREDKKNSATSLHTCCIKALTIFHLFASNMKPERAFISRGGVSLMFRRGNLFIYIFLMMQLCCVCMRVLIMLCKSPAHDLVFFRWVLHVSRFSFTHSTLALSLFALFK